MEMLIKFACC